MVILAGFLLLAVVYMLPAGRMKSHIAESDEVFNYEGIYPQLMYGIKSSQLDNYTDGLIRMDLCLLRRFIPAAGMC